MRNASIVFLGALVVAIGLLGIFAKEISLFSKSMSAGGGLGHIIGGALLAYLNEWGSLVLLIMLLCAGFMIGYDVSTPYKSMLELASTIKENREFRKKKAEMENRSKSRPQKSTQQKP